MADLHEKLTQMAGSKGAMTLRHGLEPRARRYAIVSVDDHLVEPPDMFTGRLPARFHDDAPRVERGDDGADSWVFEDQRVPVLGAEAIQGWEPGTGSLGPVSFDEMNPGVWDVHARVEQMDVNGVAASLNFPSGAFGFAGQRFLRMRDRELGLASMRAFNDWILEEWAGPYPERIIPCQVSWLADPLVAAQEIERNAARGFKAVTFSENPEKLGLPSMYQEHWDPFLRACEETETVVNLHVGSSSETFVPSKDSPGGVVGALFPMNALAACVDWLFARVPVRFPRIKIAMSEGGIGWVPMLIDRFAYRARNGEPDDFGGLLPAELARRNYWFTTFADPTTLVLRDRIGVDRITVETDYPHGDSSWPDTQALLATQLAGIPEDEADLITHENACALYRHQLPAGWVTERP